MDRGSETQLQVGENVKVLSGVKVNVNDIYYFNTAKKDEDDTAFILRCAYLLVTHCHQIKTRTVNCTKMHHQYTYNDSFLSYLKLL